MAYGNVYSVQIGNPGNGLNQATSRYELIVTDTFTNACAIARTMCHVGEIVMGVSLNHPDAVVDIDSLNASD